MQEDEALVLPLKVKVPCNEGIDIRIFLDLNHEKKRGKNMLRQTVRTKIINNNLPNAVGRE